MRTLPNKRSLTVPIDGEYLEMRAPAREVDDHLLREVTCIALNGSDTQWQSFLKLLRVIGVFPARCAP